MSAEWKWYVTRAGDWDAFGFESDTREEAIAAFVRDEGYIEIEVCEARFSTAKRYEGADFVPFAAVRNKERFMPNPTSHDPQ